MYWQSNLNLSTKTLFIQFCSLKTLGYDTLLHDKGSWKMWLWYYKLPLLLVVTGYTQFYPFSYYMTTYILSYNPRMCLNKNTTLFVNCMISGLSLSFLSKAITYNYNYASRSVQ